MKQLKWLKVPNRVRRLKGMLQHDPFTIANVIHYLCHLGCESRLAMKSAKLLIEEWVAGRVIVQIEIDNDLPRYQLCHV